MTIRKLASDFRVRERIAASFRQSIRPRADALARHAVYEVSKCGVTTPDAVNVLARAIRMPAGVLSYAGLKDRHAESTQWVSAELRVRSGEDAIRAGAALPAIVTEQRVAAKLMGFVDQPLAAAAIDGNSFEITVRDLDEAACAEMDRRAKLLAREAGTLLVTNYFGAQRFGSARHGKGWVARALIAGDFEEAIRLAVGTPWRRDQGRTRAFTRLAAEAWGEWSRLARDLPRCPERRPFEALAAGATARDAFATLPPFLKALYLEAFQSKLWNEAARQLTRRAAGGPAAPSAVGAAACLRGDDEFGELLFAPAAALTDDFIAMQMPLPARKTTLAPPWGDAMQLALGAEGLSLADLRVKGIDRPFFGEAMRAICIAATSFDLRDPEPDELAAPGARALKRAVSFDLPRGAYATVVLRALGQ